jgi:hypothetical protein
MTPEETCTAHQSPKSNTVALKILISLLTIATTASNLLWGSAVLILKVDRRSLLPTTEGNGLHAANILGRK